MTVSIRAAVPEDNNFIYSTVLKSYRFSNPIARATDDDTYYSQHSYCWNRLISDPSTRVMVACMEDDPDLIIGFLIAEPKDLPILHYVYVKAAFRGHRVATDLCASVNINPRERYTYYTHWTIDVLGFGFNHKLIYNPMYFNWRPKQRVIAQGEDSERANREDP